MEVTANPRALKQGMSTAAQVSARTYGEFRSTPLDNRHLLGQFGLLVSLLSENIDLRTLILGS